MKRLMASADDDNVNVTVISSCAELEFLTKMLPYSMLASNYMFLMVDNASVAM